MGSHAHWRSVHYGAVVHYDYVGEALKVLGYPTQAKERNGRLFVVPQREIQKHPHRKHEDLEIVMGISSGRL